MVAHARRRTYVTLALLLCCLSLAGCVQVTEESDSGELLANHVQDCRLLGGGWTYRRASDGVAQTVDISIDVFDAGGTPLSDLELRRRRAARVANGFDDDAVDVLRASAVTDDGVVDALKTDLTIEELRGRLPEVQARLRQMPTC